MAKVGPGPYFVDVVFKEGRSWAIARVSARVSRAVAFGDAASILREGLVMQGQRYDVRGVIVDRTDRPAAKRRRSYYD